jgi:hypothetical protein
MALFEKFIKNIFINVNLSILYISSQIVTIIDTHKNIFFFLFIL